MAYLGPVYTFSHDLVRKHFKQEQHQPCKTLHDVVEAVAKGECDCGVVPFYNTTRRSIEETQVELIAHKGAVTVSDVLSMEVCHFICGFGSLSDVTEIRSKSVVFHQTNKWLQKNLPKAEQKGYESTSLAVTMQ